MRTLLILGIGLVSLPLRAEVATVVAPPCAHPASIHNQFDGAPGHFITFKASAGDPQAVAAALSKRYHFRVTDRYSWGAIFVSELSARKVSKLRCAPEVDFIEFNTVVHGT